MFLSKRLIGGEISGVRLLVCVNHAYSYSVFTGLAQCGHFYLDVKSNSEWSEILAFKSVCKFLTNYTTQNNKTSLSLRSLFPSWVLWFMWQLRKYCWMKSFGFSFYLLLIGYRLHCVVIFVALSVLSMSQHPENDIKLSSQCVKRPFKASIHLRRPATIIHT